MNNSESNFSDATLYIVVRDDISDWIIEHGLSKTESKLFFYFSRLDRFGDRPVKLKVAEILLATGIGKTAYHSAIAKFEALGWFDFKHTDVTISNNISLGSSEKRTFKPEKRTEKPEKRTEKPESRTGKANQKTGKTENQTLEPLHSNDSEAPHTIHTYSSFLHTLSDTEKGEFESFCKRKVRTLDFEVKQVESWLNKYHLEYWHDFKSRNSEKQESNSERPSLRYLKGFHLNNSEAFTEAAKHHGYSREEIEEFLNNLNQEGNTNHG
jgi:hypothetical protein